MIDRAAVSHRMDRTDCFALEEDLFMLRLRTGRDSCDEVILHYTDKYLYHTGRAAMQTCQMNWVTGDGYLDYFECSVRTDAICLRYFFELRADGETLYYGNYAFYGQEIRALTRMFDCPVQSRLEQRFSVPDWAKGAVFYQIFPDRFASGRPVNPNRWYKTPMEPDDRLGGDLRGIRGRLAYLAGLGVDAIYLNPIFLADSVHKYDVVDYKRVDPAFGGEAELAALVREAHARGIRIVLDGVFNHTSEHFFAFRDLVENGPDSRYADWYYPLSYPLKAEYGQKPTYLTFGYRGGMPKLRCANPEVQDYIIEVAAYWMRTFEIDGWRLDVGDEIGHDFWRRFRAEIKKINPEALLVGEHWYYAPEFLQGDEWDSVMNYHFKDAVTDFVARRELTASQFADRLGFMRGNIHPEAYFALWNLIDCHDTERFLTAAGGDRRKQKLAAALQLLTSGAPMLYYGDEVAMEGGEDPDCRRGMLWDPQRLDSEMLAWYRKLLALRWKEPVLLNGALACAGTSDDADVLALERSGNGRQLALLFHNGEGRVSVPAFAGLNDLLNDRDFSGMLGPYETAVLEMKPDEGAQP